MSPTESETEILTLAEAASYLRVSEEELRKLASEGRIPAQKIGEDWRFLKSAVHDWLRYGPLPAREWFRMGPPWLFEYPPLEVLLAQLEQRLTAKILSLEAPPSKPGSKQRVLEKSGRWKEDRAVDGLLAEIYKRRGRPMTEEDG